MSIRFMNLFLIWAHQQAPKKWEYLLLTTTIPFCMFLLGFLLWPHYDMSQAFIYAVPAVAFLGGMFISANLGPKSPLTFWSLSFFTALCQSNLLNIFFGQFLHYRVFIFVFAATTIFAFLGMSVTAIMRFMVLNVSNHDLENSQFYKLLKQVIPPVISAWLVYLLTGQIP